MKNFKYLNDITKKFLERTGIREAKRIDTRKWNFLKKLTLQEYSEFRQIINEFSKKDE